MHGHSCLKDRSKFNRYGIKLDDAAYALQLKKNDLLTHPDIEVVIIKYACEWEEEKKNNLKIREFLDRQNDLKNDASRFYKNKLVLRNSLKGTTGKAYIY